MDKKTEDEIKNIIEKIKIWFKATVNPDFNFDVILDEDETFRIIKV